MPSGDDEDEELAATLESSVDEGDVRLQRSLRTLAATGLVGGADVALGVFALLLVKQATHSEVLASLAFSIGFIALLLAHSELFTENFLLPVVAVVARRGRVGDIVRLWVGTAGANLVGGWIVMGLVMTGFPDLHGTAVEVATRYMALGITWRALAIGVLGGAAITCMAWLERGA